ncbi:hypothetical protein SDC9_62593 [bioreactor metagenome]|uniref:CHAT domain-containing protein n=1 Tax=bioreactor metagenome TaxID=1076179 RepID=A0A644XJ44_9ZZZZ
MKKVFGENHSYYALSLNNLASNYYEIGNYQKSIELNEKSLEIRKKVLGENHPSYAQSLNNLAINYSAIGNYQKSIELNEKSLEIRKKVLGENHPDYATSLSNLAISQYDFGLLSQSSKNIAKAFELTKVNILKNFSEMTESERNMFWENNNGIIPYINKSTFESFTKENSFVSLCFDGALFTKGLLLSSSVAFNKIILESGDSLLIDLYDKYRINRKILEKQYEKPISERFFNTDSLENISSEYEKQLIKKSKDFGDFTKDISMDWKEIQKELKKDEIAIEFIESYIGKDSVMYSALLLRTEWDSPKFIPLFEKREIESKLNVNINALYSPNILGKELYSKVWSPISKFIEKGDKIYFAPTGILYQMPIEYLPSSDTSEVLMNEYYKIKRVSTTKEIVRIHNSTKQEYGSAVLYGDLSYDLDNNTLLTQSSKYTTNELYATRGIISSSQRGGVWSKLEYTKIELDKIKTILTDRKIKTITYTKEEGNEESFKNLDGKKNKIIHVATHGFYLEEKEKRNDNYLQRMIINDNAPHKVDLSLYRSGLILSGGNIAWRGDTIPSNIEDGILLSKEISSLDLRGTELLVLSACQTGLGEVKTEGVFGLQRAFKNSGVKTIIASLWEVSDVITAEMMTFFYTNLTNGDPKQIAFNKAQQTIKTKYPENPEYWAAFIIID